MMGYEEFKAKYGRRMPYSPASALESEDCYHAMGRSIWISFIIYLLLAYGLSFYFINDRQAFLAIYQSHADLLEGRLLSRFEANIQELTEFDGVSNISYVVSALAAQVVGVGLVAVQVALYGKYVLLKERATRIDRRAFVGLFGAFAGAAIIWWIYYFHEIDLVGNRYPGMTRIFIWPYQPVVGYSGAFATMIFGFQLVAGAWKLVVQFGEGRND